MKTTLLSLVGSLLLSFTLSAQVPRLEIHHIGAGDGDATLIIAIDSVNALNIQGKKYLDTAIILIDGQRASGGKEVWRYVRDTVTALSPKLKRIDYIVVSHLHIDHYGGVPYIISQAKQNGWNIQKVIDRQSADYSNFQNGLTVPDSCYDSLSAPNPDAASFKRYQDTLKKYKLTPTFAPLPANDLLSVFNFDDIKMYCVVSCGLTFALNPDPKVADTCFLPIVNASGRNYYKPRSENDLSIGWLIDYQGFHYLTLGDLGGVSGGGYTDGETPVTKWLLQTFNSPEYHICANKVSHHGSRESTSEWFADKNNFTASVFPASLRSYGTSQHALPTQTAIENLKNTGKDTLLYTFIPQNPQTLSSYWKKNNLEYYNDVIIKILGEPGFDDINLKIIERKKNKKSVYLSPATVLPIICNKGHDWAE